MSILKFLGLEAQEVADLVAFLREDPDAPPRYGEAIELFDGRTFRGWTFHSSDPDTKLKDVWAIPGHHVLVCSGSPAGYLRTTEDYTNFLFTVCLAYGGREEIVDAVREVASDHAKGELALESIDTEQISSRMYTADLPDPDLVIRPSGEERISNFLLWQIAYSELHFTDVYWPSFSKEDLYEAIESYQSRRRRYGG